MAKQRFASPIIQLPSVPPELDPFKRAVEVVLSQLVTPGVFRVHELDMVNPIRGGAAGGAYLPVGALYVDEDGIVRMVTADQQWVMPTTLVQKGGPVTAI